MTKIAKQGFHVILTSVDPIGREDYDAFLQNHRGKSYATLLGEGVLTTIHEGHDCAAWFKAGKGDD